MDGVDEINCEAFDNLVVIDRMDLDEDFFLQLDDGDPNKDRSLGYTIKDKYNWLEYLKIKIRIILMKMKYCHS